MRVLCQPLVALGRPETIYPDRVKDESPFVGLSQVEVA
jgi:hypothetical protein